jgi:hypothetical protein
MKDKPVSEAPTITIRALFVSFRLERSFLQIIDSENGAYYWSNGSR